MEILSLNGTEWLYKGYIGEDWLWRNAHQANSRDVRGWKRATVPGSVQNDLWQAGIIPDPYAGTNSLAIEWVPERTWLYKRTFTANQDLRGKRVQLIFEGVDYSARFYLNGEMLGQNTGMFIPAAFEVGNLLNFDRENLLVVVIDPAPFEQPQIGYTSRVYTQKARMNYWWDFCSRMVHLGIWQDVYLRVSGPTRIEEVHVQPEPSTNLLRADVNVRCWVDAPENLETRLAVGLRQVGGEEVIQEAAITLSSEQRDGVILLHMDYPNLWWPNGAGEQPLYEVEVTAFTTNVPSDSQKVTFGIRRLAFEPNEGAAPGTLPYNLVVNGRKIFIKGWNWVPMDVLYGVEQPAKRERLLQLAKNANVNLLRVWGGGLIEKEAFYQICDQLGILVWQEFIQSSSGVDNIPSDDPQFIEFLVQNAEVAIRARRNHASLVVWCGGNELHHRPDHLCDDRTPALAALKEAVARLDPGKHWVPTSPAGGVFSFGIPENEAASEKLQDVHGPWEYQGLREQYDLYNRGSSLLHSEFGVEGLTNLRSLNQTIPAAQQWPVSLENPIWEHLGAWWVKENVWQEVFGGPFKNIQAAQRATQFLQADGLRYAVEADRRRMFHNGGTMPWQFNEPYPMAACTSAVDYFAEPKPVYYSVARAYCPISITARFATLAWGGESEFSAEIWLANSGTEQVGELAVQVMELDGRNLYDKTIQVTCAKNRALAQLIVTLPLERVKGDLFLPSLALRGSSGDLLATNRYLFSKTENLAPLLANFPVARVNARVEKSGMNWLVMLENISNQAALWLWLEGEKQDLREPGYVYFEDNYFCLLPGEQRTLKARWSGVPDVERVVRCTGWNFGTFDIR